jgi:hypothetical protein
MGRLGAVGFGGRVPWVIPLLLLWRYPRPTREQPRTHRLEFLISAMCATGAVAYLLFGTDADAADVGASFLVLLPLLWMALRSSLSHVFPMLAAMIGMTVVGTMLGNGPFFGVDQGGVFVLFAQMAIGFSAAVLLLGSAANQQRELRTRCAR